MPVNSFLYLTDARSEQNTFLYAPTTRANANNFLYTCYGTNGPVPMSDADAAAYATAAQVLATPERNALNALVVALKAAGLWTKMTAMYPMTPSSVSLVDSYKLNLKNTATHALTVPVDISCSLEGLRNTLNTTNVCTSSTLNYDVVNVENNAIGVYHRTAAPPTNDTDISVSGGGTSNFLTTRGTGAIGGLPGEAGYLHYSSNVGANILSGLAGSPGLHVLNRLAGTSTYYVQSTAIETKVGTTITQPTGGLFTLGSRSLARISFAFVSTALTSVEVNALNTIVDIYQAALTTPRDYTSSQLLDADANNFYTLAQLPRWRHVEIINDLVTGLKTASLWTLLDVLYPFIGGNAYRHSLNLRNSLLYQIAWSGNLSHNASGVVGVAGGSGVGFTGFIQSKAQCYLGLYVPQSSGPQAAQDWGTYEGLTASHIHFHYADNNAYLDIGGVFADGRVFAAMPSSTGYVGGGNAGGSLYMAFNASVLVSRLSVGGVTTTAYRLFRGDSSGQGAQTPNRTYALAVAGSGLTPAQHSTLYTLIQTYQTAMGRAV
jgi:hypothetical protein